MNTTTYQCNHTMKKQYFFNVISLRYKFPIPEIIVRRCSVKNVCLKISHNLQKDTGEESLFNKVADRRPEARNVIKKETLAQVFSCKFCQIFKNISERLLLVLNIFRAVLRSTNRRCLLKKEHL